MKNLNQFYLLALGALLITLTHMRFGLGMLVFIEPLPFIIYLNRTKGIKSKLLVLAFLFAGWSLATAKILSDPIPWFIMFAYGLPLAIFKFLPFMGYSYFKKNRLIEWIYPALFVIGEWLQTSFTPFASWGSAAYTQINNIVWLQSVSIGGIWLLSYFIYFIAFQLYLMIQKGKPYHVSLKLVLPIIIVSVFGTMRIVIADDTSRESVTVSAIGTNSIIGGPKLPSPEEQRKNLLRIYRRMITASQAGAKLIVWTEAATGMLPEEEQSFQLEVSRLTDSLDVTAVVSYVILTSVEPFHYDNKYILIDSTGTIQSVYHKHQPVPGEPCTPGTEPHTVFDMEGTQVGGAICYDYDFPALGREISSLGADIVAVPSSDWRGIDPIHTQMAALRAIEGGYSLIRSTRWGLSAAVDRFGRVAGQLSDFNSEDKILIASLPKQGARTIYSVVGDWVVLVSGLIVLLAIILDRKKTPLE